MITNFFIPELNNHDVQELGFQQDGATCRTARATIDLLKDTFGDRLISRFGPVNWPPRSCDLTPIDYFLWGYVKSLVYADKSQTLGHLEDNIRRVIADIEPQMLEKVIDNWTSRLDYIRASRGCHMPEIIFKIHVISGKGRKADFIKLAIELGECESNGEKLKIIELRTKIFTNDAYKEDPEFVKCIFEGIVSNRIDEENKQKEQTLREFELQKIRLQNETQRVVGPQTLPQTKIELKKLLPTFNPEVDNMDLFLTLFERQMKLLDLGEDLWVPYLIGALPSDVTSLIAREPEEKCRDYSHI
ncbi:uncharacterized protein TNCV_4820991 [Trichonephila clavipes]|nr:uncharacterized protein TNCV_4820991 [Trichonephila clavipes]